MSAQTAQPPPDNGGFSLYPYEPSKAAANIFYVLFAISGFVHFIQTFQFKSWRFTALLPWAGFLYTAGFITRQVSAFHQDNVGLYIASVCLLYVAPPVYLAANYFTFGRVLHYIPYLSPIHPGRVVSTFIGLDVIIEVLTGQGAWRLTQWDKPDELNIGFALIKTSLILQFVLFFGFVALQVIFHRRCIRAGVLSPNMRGILYILYASNSLIFLRNIFRAIEVFFASAKITYLANHEVFVYVFDALPLLINTLMLNIVHPAVFLPHSTKVFLSRDGITERRGPGYKDKRNFFVTVFDPFDLGGLIRGKDDKTKFWEKEEEYPVFTEEENPATACRYSGKRPLWVWILDPFNIGGFLMMWSNKRARAGRTPQA